MVQIARAVLTSGHSLPKTLAFPPDHPPPPCPEQVSGLTYSNVHYHPNGPLSTRFPGSLPVNSSTWTTLCKETAKYLQIDNEAEFKTPNPLVYEKTAGMRAQCHRPLPTLADYKDTVSYLGINSRSNLFCGPFTAHPPT
ncbi:unnamed protein product [Nezara viridula]|uniref:Uncharacterized protein n=1 Tax=Nezara viridula TaxID=85310 RepID=A0A9P0HGY5_NEZVI|nr:unnamed protein product [Nezara viridula]